jgi:release factor glutamine methyltransferase
MEALAVAVKPAGALAPVAPSAGITVAAALRAAETTLVAAGCASPRLDAELLLADALGARREALYGEPEQLLPARAARRLARHLDRRALREPVAYILGRRAFRHLELAVDRRVLIPRPETELLVEVGLADLAPGGHVHDAGTGSGAVALALKDERPDLAVTASDASAAALAVARANAERLGLDVEFVVGRDLPSAAGRPQLLVANLPYVRDDEWPDLAPEITRYEPRAALLGGGADGLDAIRGLVASAPSGTRLALEHSPAQTAAVRGLLRDARSFRGAGGGEDVTLGRPAGSDEEVTRGAGAVSGEVASPDQAP